MTDEDDVSVEDRTSKSRWGAELGVRRLVRGGGDAVFVGRVRGRGGGDTDRTVCAH